MKTLRGHKYAILLVALLGVTVVDSFSQRPPVFSELAILTTMLLVFLIVFERRGDRLVHSWR